MMHASITGRAAFDARGHTTRNGNDMASCRLAVDVTGKDADEQQTLWVDVLCFGQQAETLGRVAKGESVSAIGRMTRGVYTPSNGEAREQWTLLADGVMTAASGRPGRQRRKQPQQSQAQQLASAAFQAPFNDSLPAF